MFYLIYQKLYIPADPCAPESPLEPGEPFDPGNPAAPREPVAPVVRGNPLTGAPARPASPVAPVVSGNPANSGALAASSGPAGSIDPVETATSAAPVAPVVSEDPASPITYYKYHIMECCVISAHLILFRPKSVYL